MFSATHFSRHLSCNHLTSLRPAVELGEIDPPPPYDDPHADVLRQRGIEHEQRLLEQLAADDACEGRNGPYTAALLSHPETLLEIPRVALRSGTGRVASPDAAELSPPTQALC